MRIIRRWNWRGAKLSRHSICNFPEAFDCKSISFSLPIPIAKSLLRISLAVVHLYELGQVVVVVEQ